jgi:predicted alpha/beta superfamily hydrolase
MRVVSSIRPLSYFLLLWLIPAGELRAQKGSERVTFDLGRRHTISSAVFGAERDLIIRLPDDYEVSGWSYPVLYMLGSNYREAFALKAAALAYMGSQGQIPPMVLVGIELPEGNFGLVPRDEADGGTESAERYLRFLEDEVFPYVQDKVRTNGYRILYGGSNSGMGALFALFSGRLSCQATIASSPMLGWSPELIFRVTGAALKGPSRDPHFLYLIASDDDFGRVRRHFADYVALLRKDTPSWLRLRAETRGNEGHVPEMDLPLALRALFAGYNPEERPADAAAFRRHYQALSQERGMTVEPPSALLFDVGYDLVSAGQAEKGLEVFELYAERYPWAAMAHAGLGFAHRERGDVEAARRSLQRALELDADNRFAQRLLKEMDK